MTVTLLTELKLLAFFNLYWCLRTPLIFVRIVCMKVLFKNVIQFVSIICLILVSSFTATVIAKVQLKGHSYESAIILTSIEAAKTFRLK
jgi:hypothetical protein